ncbi:MAG: glutamate--cysteine ligase [Pelagibacterales bacterium]|nr:glutamate--cysteine ligase [Pelagibacterales bacterium]PPR16272.1 MAG: Glutamate--cysteine ligase EgtA [Alphaproteobacteria bacterium MarineAlpha9_Bin3]|tara:strand:- start:15496 stop:16830 length:1335 start_codon:yes stop_codon:yes gene_type:complete
MDLKKNDLINWFVEGCKPKELFRIGTEHEKFVYKMKNLEPVSYEEKSGIKNILESLINFGWEEIREEGYLIALKKDKQSITLEPGGQLELSGAPLENIHQTCSEVNEHLRQVKLVGKDLNIGFLGVGARLEGKLSSNLWMPKPRYKIMREYMPKVGTKGLEMMADTCTVQVNLDYSSEEDMSRKLKTSFILQPIVTALFSSSPIEKMKISKFISRRAAIWFDVDKDRCGIPKFIFKNNLGFEDWVDYALKVPMYFVRRNGKYINCAGDSFEKFMDGKLDKFPDERPTLLDWEDHLSTIFTEIRLKKFIEFRGADTGPWGSLCALPALWVGLLYDDEALNESESLANSWTPEMYHKAYSEVPIKGMDLIINNNSIKDYAKELIKISKMGLKNRKRLDSSGNDETGYLNQLEEITYSGKNQATEMLNIWNNNEDNGIREIYKRYSY